MGNNCSLGCADCRKDKNSKVPLPPLKMNKLPESIGSEKTKSVINSARESPDKRFKLHLRKS